MWTCPALRGSRTTPELAERPLKWRRCHLMITTTHCILENVLLSTRNCNSDGNSAVGVVLVRFLRFCRNEAWSFGHALLRLPQGCKKRL